MIIGEGLNADSYMTEKKYIQEAKGVKLKITGVLEASNTELDINFECIDGVQEGAIHKERYWTTPPTVGEDGTVISNGGLWRVRKLMIACGLYEVREDGAKIVKAPFDTKMFLDKMFVADFIRRESKNGRTYTNLANERPLEKDDAPF